MSVVSLHTQVHDCTDSGVGVAVVALQQLKVKACRGYELKLDLMIQAARDFTRDWTTGRRIQGLTTT